MNTEKWKWHDIHLCSSFNPSKVHTHSSEHTPWTHTWSSGQPFMLQRPGRSCALLKDSLFVVLRVERALDIHSPIPTVPAAVASTWWEQLVFTSFCRASMVYLMRWRWWMFTAYRPIRSPNALGTWEMSVMTGCPNETNVGYSLGSTSHCCSSVTIRMPSSISFSTFLMSPDGWEKKKNITLLNKFINEHTYVHTLLKLCVKSTATN